MNAETKTKTKFIALNSLNIVTRFHAQFSVQKKVLTNVDNVCVIYETHSSLPNKTFGFVHRRQEQNVMPMTKWVYNHNHTTATATLMPTTMLAERNETYALYIIYTCIFRIEFPSPFHICFMLFFPSYRSFLPF